MKISKYKYYTELIGEDDKGEFAIRIHNDCSQLRLTAEDGDESAYIDINRTELECIRDLIDQVLIENKST